MTNSREPTKSARVWRRRTCDACSKSFTTNELPVYSQILVEKRDGKQQDFSRLKLFFSLLRALEPRKDAAEAGDALTDTLINHLLPSEKLHSKQIANEAMRMLKRFDSSALVRYASLQENLSGTRELKKILKEYS